MAKKCEITGKRVIPGNHKSHSNKRERRKFYPNLHVKKFYVPEEDRWLKLRVSTTAIRNINKRGIYKCLQEAREKGYTTK